MVGSCRLLCVRSFVLEVRSQSRHDVPVNLNGSVHILQLLRPRRTATHGDRRRH